MRHKDDEKLRARVAEEAEKFRFFKDKLLSIVNSGCEESEEFVESSLCSYILNFDMTSMNEQEKDFILNKIGEVVNEDQLLYPVRLNIMKYLHETLQKQQLSRKTSTESIKEDSSSSETASNRGINIRDQKNDLRSRTSLDKRNLRRSKVNFED